MTEDGDRFLSGVSNQAAFGMEIRMDYKILALIIIGITFVFSTWMELLDLKALKRPMPENVKDIYDAEAYEKWMQYYREKCRLSFVRHLVSYLVTFVLIGFDVYAVLFHLSGTENVYAAAIFVTIADTVLSMLWSIPFSYKDDMGIEQKYGFNRMTKKIFVVDCIKELVLNLCLMCGLISIFIAIHLALGNWLLVAFTGVMLVFLLVMVFISPFMAKMYNKLESLPEGELRDKLTQLLESNGCTVKDIKVSDGSKRSSKANAYFSGFGKTKTIVLYDTLMEQMTEDEIVAVFAHEMGHNKHKDTLKLYGLNILNNVIMVVLAWVFVSFPEIYRDFGFDEMNYGFAFVLLGNVGLAFTSPFIGIFVSGMSRKFEYAADRFAAENGYGKALVSGLKKLSRNNFSCLTPHPLVVKLTYSHPTTGDRIANIEKS